MVKRIMAEWESLPTAITKPLRDFAATFLGLAIASGAFQQDTPDWRTAATAVGAAASLAGWRTLRAQLPGVQSG